MLRALLMLLVAIAAPALAGPQEIALDGGRWYRIDLPPRPAGAPILLALHGGGGNPDQFAGSSGLVPPAKAAGYAVIWPAGTPTNGEAPSPDGSRRLSWNAGACCTVRQNPKIDDVGFLAAVIADAARRFGLDATRVYPTGISNGAMMAERYAATRPLRVRAVAGVAGTLNAGIAVTGPVPLLHIHGMADRMAPYDGGPGQRWLTQSIHFNPVDQAVAAFVAAAGPPLTESRQVIDPAADGMRVFETEWSRPDGLVMVRLLTIEGGRHVWPGGNRAGGTGSPSDIDATAEILRFFAEHL